MSKKNNSQNPNTPPDKNNPTSDKKDLSNEVPDMDNAKHFQSQEMFKDSDYRS